MGDECDVVLKRVRRDLDYYLKEHQNKYNLIFHYIAFLSAFLAWICLFVDLRLTVFLTFNHYILSWIGHFYFERNKPASFRYPHIGFYIGFIWFFIKTYEIITGHKILQAWINKNKQTSEGA
ncbi:MAG: hypothetical protein K0Q73_6952 [Paenibacillus sp.]|jgi:hypothetical protein|nr:hypothetical protein [Paenibacillus sp.]